MKNKVFLLKTIAVCTLLLINFSFNGFTQQVNNKKKLSFPIDFSCAGYCGGGATIPAVVAALKVEPGNGDNTKLLQAAIDSIGKLPIKTNGFRGALQLSGGIFKISGQLNINKSGIVIRGAYKGEKTVLVASGEKRRALIKIKPKEKVDLGLKVEITDSIVKAGAVTFTAKNAKNFNKGDYVLITRPCTKEWITDIGMDKKEGTFVNRRGLRWHVGSRILKWDRMITSIDYSNNKITIDAPITTALKSEYGGGTIQEKTNNGIISNIGIENIEFKSEFDPANTVDEEHAWFAIFIDYARDCWLNGITAKHFVSSLVHTGHHGRRISILNCHCEKPVSETAGYRRQSFWIEGQQVLVQNCTADSGMNDFAIGLCAAGPNVFINCRATNALGASGAFESWSSGTLYENVDINGSGILLTYDFERSQGGGWTAANSVVWNCTADHIEVTGPYCAPNQYVSSDSSLYFCQLKQKLKTDNIKTFRFPPKVNIPNSLNTGEFTINDIPKQKTKPKPSVHTVEIVNGRFVRDGKLVWGGLTRDPLWKGQTSPNANAGRGITRFVPGKEGEGLTENLPEMARQLVTANIDFYEIMPGLWYERRRDDHRIAQRTDKNVWAPFFEMPWQRSGQGKAWDGLSKYDLNKYNPWYFARCRKFAELCDKNGILLYCNLYNTHNLLEYLTHWVDYPWRPANNINQTGLPEPPPFEPWARAHMGNQFYNPGNTNLRKLHHAYIFHTLDELGNNANIVFKLGPQYAGPISFQRFFIETIHEWEELHNKNVKIVIAAAKDVTDSIMSDANLAKQVDIIDTRYWQYRSEDASFSSEEKLWAPPGGTNRSFREMVGENFILQSDYPFSTTEENMYREVREYHDRFPDKAILSAFNNVNPMASLMAGGAQVLMRYNQNSRPGHTSFYVFVNQYLSDILMNLTPSDELLSDTKHNWCMTDRENHSVLMYSLRGSSFSFNKSIEGKSYSGTWYDPLTERVIPIKDKITVTKNTKLEKPTKYRWLLLLRLSNVN